MNLEWVLGVTGTRKGANKAQKELILEIIDWTRVRELHHGDCVGVDETMFEIAKARHIRTVAHPPDKDVLRAFTKSDEIRKPLPYLVRNRNIVSEVSKLVGVPSTMKERMHSGTWYTIRHARKMRCKIMTIYPDGTVRLE